MSKTDRVVTTALDGLRVAFAENHGLVNDWIPVKALCDAVNYSTTGSFTVSSITRALNKNPAESFTDTRGCNLSSLSLNPRWLNSGTTKVNFYYARSSNGPLPKKDEPSKSPYWQVQFEKFNGLFSLSDRQERAAARKRQRLQQEEEKEPDPQQHSEIGIVGLTSIIAKALDSKIVTEEPHTPHEQVLFMKSLWNAAALPGKPFPRQILSQPAMADENYTEPKQRMRGRYRVEDILLEGTDDGHVVRDVPSDWMVILKSKYGKLEKSLKVTEAILDALKKALGYQQVKSTHYSQMLHAAYTSAFPTVTTHQQAVLIALSRYTFIKDAVALVDNDLVCELDFLVDFSSFVRVSPTRRTL